MGKKTGLKNKSKKGPLNGLKKGKKNESKKRVQRTGKKNMFVISFFILLFRFLTISFE